LTKCYVCHKETENQFLLSRFSFESHVGKKRLRLKCQWADDENKDIAICQSCCATTLGTFARSFIESLSGEPKSIM
jgi:hypothetical protein